MLAPFSTREDQKSLFRVLDLEGDRLAHASIKPANDPRRTVVTLSASATLSAKALKNARRQIRTMLRMDEDLSSFYRVLAREPSLRAARRRGAGRLLRAPSVFEDVLKIICTTNCTWKQTVAMVDRLVEGYGHSDGSGAPAFPRPQAIVRSSEASFDRRVRAGYRSRHLYEIADAQASARIDLEALGATPFEGDELYRRLLTLPGVGPYAAAGLQTLLGRYDRLALDSWCRRAFAERHRKGGRVSDRAIERFYRRFTPYQGLAMWVDLTEDVTEP